MRNLTDAAITGKWLVDFIPFIKYIPSWMPGAHFKRMAEETSRLKDDIRKVPFDAMLAQLVSPLQFFFTEKVAHVLHGYSILGKEITLWQQKCIRTFPVTTIHDMQKNSKLSRMFVLFLIWVGLVSSNLHLLYFLLYSLSGGSDTVSRLLTQGYQADCHPDRFLRSCVYSGNGPSPRRRQKGSRRD